MKSLELSINSKLHIHVTKSNWGRNEAERGDSAATKKGKTEVPDTGRGQKYLNTLNLRKDRVPSRAQDGADNVPHCLILLVDNFYFIYFSISYFDWKDRTLAWVKNRAQFQLSCLYSWKLCLPSFCVQFITFHVQFMFYSSQLRSSFTSSHLQAFIFKYYYNI